MRMTWADLGFLHWEIPEPVLRPLVPGALEIDTFEGRAFVGLVPFTMRGVRPIWSPSIPWLSSFHEVNVRTYVHHQGRDPGVWFLSLDAANPIAVVVARTIWKLPYHFARMRLRREARLANSGQSEGAAVRYGSDRRWPRPLPGACALVYEPTGPVVHAVAGTLEHFLAERYVLYAFARGRLFSGRVHHPPYPLQTARVADLDESLLAAAGLVRPDGPPLVHYASGVDVEVFPLEPARSARES
jgi:uncharacterized protein YqjF (DUF2071 family)